MAWEWLRATARAQKKKASKCQKKSGTTDIFFATAQDPGCIQGCCDRLSTYSPSDEEESVSFIRGHLQTKTCTLIAS